MKKIENLIREGLPSKIYLAAFPIPKSRYQIAKEIYHREKYPPTSKVSVQTKLLLEKGYIRENEDKKIISNVVPLIIEIEKDLAAKEITLIATERAQLTAFLDNDLRKFIIEHKQNIVNKPLSKQADAYQALTHYIGVIVKPKMMIGHFYHIPEIKKSLLNADPEFDMEFTDQIMKIQLSDSLMKKLEMFVPIEMEMALALVNMIADPAMRTAKYILEKENNSKLF